MKIKMGNGEIDLTPAEYLILAKLGVVEAKIGGLFDFFIATLPAFSIPNETARIMQKAKDDLFNEIDNAFTEFQDLLAKEK